MENEEECTDSAEVLKVIGWRKQQVKKNVFLTEFLLKSKAHGLLCSL